MKAAALDIGGANIKGADTGGRAFSSPFPLWRRPDKLADALRGLIGELLPADVLAITMTGELCDAFETKTDGVRHILEQTLVALRGRSDAPPVYVWTTEGAWVLVERGTRPPLSAAASNWLALARFAARYATGRLAVLLDIGSTTTDIIPLRDGVPVPLGLTDTARLAAGELVYTGAARTPVAMLMDRLPYRGQLCPVAAEMFATTLDAHVLLGDVPESASGTGTADGRAADRSHARDRMARMICADRDTFTPDDALLAARAVREAQERLVGEAIDRVIARLAGSPSTMIVSGSGEFLARRLAGARCSRIVSLGEVLGPERSAAACAVALAELAKER